LTWIFGTYRLRKLLKSDVNDLAAPVGESYAHWHADLFRRHPRAVFSLDLLFYLALVAALWWWLGTVVGLIALAAVGLLYGYGSCALSGGGAPTHRSSSARRPSRDTGARQRPCRPMASASCLFGQRHAPRVIRGCERCGKPRLGSKRLPVKPTPHSPCC
jgi:hypothetical protein